MTEDVSNNMALPGKGMSGQEYIRRRLIHFGVTIIIMGVCFPLYYLGFFGTVEGPLNPSQLGATLAGLGISKTHLTLLFATFLVVSVTWNWIFNRVSLLRGSRLTCIKKTDNNGSVCGAPVSRKKVYNKKSGVWLPRYECIKGHKLGEARFHPVKKGTLAHTLWVMSLLLCVIIFLF